MVLLTANDAKVGLTLRLRLQGAEALGVGVELRVPQIADEDDARMRGHVPHLMLKRVVEEQHLTFHPWAWRVISATDAAVAWRHDQS